MDILSMTKDDLLGLSPEDITLEPKELVHIAKQLGAFWEYDYHALKEGRPGMHAELKSGLHSDGFFVSRILLKPENIRRIISKEMYYRLSDALKGAELDWVAGVPDGATKLGEDIAEYFHVRNVKMEKIDGRITVAEDIPPETFGLLVEDFCTRGTGLAEDAKAIKEAQPSTVLLPFNPVIINRGGVRWVMVRGAGAFKVLPVVNWTVYDWKPGNCPLCQEGSVPIKPKATDDNWEAITTSQL